MLRSRYSDDIPRDSDDGDIINLVRIIISDAVSVQFSDLDNDGLSCEVITRGTVKDRELELSPLVVLTDIDNRPHSAGDKVQVYFLHLLPS